MLQLLRLFRQAWSRKPSCRRPVRTRLCAELLESRTVPTIVLQPNFAGEAVIANPHTALTSATTYLLFEGPYWGTAQGVQDRATLTAEVQSVLTGPYLSGLSQYTPTGGPVQTLFGGSYADTSALPAGFAAAPNSGFNWSVLDAKVLGAIGNPNSGIPAPSAQDPLYVVVTDPTVPAGSVWGSYNETSAATGMRHELWVGTSLTGAGSVNTTYFGLNFSHELVETLSGKVAVSLPPPFQDVGDQVSDGEPNHFSPITGLDYSAVVNGVRVQAYWSQVDGAFIVPDGQAQVTELRPVWAGDAFTGQYETVTAPAAVTQPQYQLAPTGILQQMVNGLWVTIDTNVRSFTLTKDGTLIDLEESGALWSYRGGTWTKVDSQVQFITQSADGTVFGLEASGRLVANQAGAWAQVDSNVQAIGLASNGAVIDQEASGTLWGYQGGTWSPVNGRVQVTLTTKYGTSYGLQQSGALWG
jgi:hypothetical protein